MGNAKKRGNGKDKSGGKSKVLKTKIHTPPKTDKGIGSTLLALFLIWLVLVSGGVYVYFFVDVDVTDVIDTIQTRVAQALGQISPTEQAELPKVPTEPPSLHEEPIDPVRSSQNHDAPQQTDPAVDAVKVKEEEEMRKQAEENVKKEEKKKKLEEERLQKEEEQRIQEEEENRKLEEEKRKKEEEQRIQEEEEKKRLEEERLQKEEKQRLQEEEEKKLEEERLQKEEEQRIQEEEEKKLEEERLQKEEEQRIQEEEENRKSEEERQQKEEEQRIQEEQDIKEEKKMQEDEKLNEEDEQRIAEEEEAKRIQEEEKLKEEEEKRIQEEEEEKRIQEEKLKEEEEKRIQEEEEEKRIQEEKLKEEEEKRIQEEEKLKEEEEKRVREEEKLREEEEKRIQAEEDDKRIQAEEEERRIQEEQKLMEEEERIKLEQEALKEEELKKEEEKKRKQEEKKNYEKIDITNNADYRIRKKLDAADQLVVDKKPNDALEKYEGVLAKHPESARAVYGVAWATDVRSEIEASNALLEDAVNLYLKVLDLPDVPKALMLKAARRCADRQQFRGWGFRAMKTMKKVLDLYPDDIALWNEYGVKGLLTSKNEEARAAFTKALEIDPNNGYALVHMGFITKQIDVKYEESIPYFQKGFATDAEGVHDGRFYFHLGDALYRTGKHDEAYKVYEQGAEKGVFYSKWQRSLYNCDGVTGRPWWTVAQTGHEDMLQLLEDNWETIRDEGMAQLDDAGLFVPEAEDLRETGDWKQFTLYQRGRKVTKNCEKAPKTCALLDKFEDATKCKRGQIKFSVMHPGVHVWPHCGPTNCRIRSHLGLVIPDGVRLRVTDETKTWKEGKFIIFDDSFEHEVWHEGDSTRLVLIVDMWHPEVTSRQKATLSPI